MLECKTAGQPSRPTSGGVGPWLRMLGTSVIDLVYPARCATCMNGCTGGMLLCAACSSAFADERASPVCPHCATTVPPHTVVADRCPRCRARRSPIDAMVRAGSDSGRTGKLLRAYKFAQSEFLESVFVEWLVEATCNASWIEEIEAVTWVPTHWSRRMRIRYYPAERLAQETGRKLGRPAIRLLARIRGGPHQIGLSFESRRRNVRGAFAMRRGGQPARHETLTHRRCLYDRFDPGRMRPRASAKRGGSRFRRRGRQSGSWRMTCDEQSHGPLGKRHCITCRGG